MYSKGDTPGVNYPGRSEEERRGGRRAEVVIKVGVNRLEQRTTLKTVQDILTLREKNGTGWSNTVCLLWLPQRRPVPRVPKDTLTHTHTQIQIQKRS